MDDLPASELRFHFEGGRPCLDLCATIGERWRRRFERLRAPEDLARWLAESGLLRNAPVREAHLEQVRALRAAVERLVTRAPGARPRPADIRLVNAWAARPALAPRLTGAGAHGGVAAPADADAVHAALSTLARDAIDLVTGPYADRVRECGADDCALLFVDTSRPGRRRWCSMDACGNRTKTAAYRRRKATPP